MSKFGGSRNNKSVPGISSGSLSDIVFMLLFFFTYSASKPSVKPYLVL